METKLIKEKLSGKIAKARITEDAAMGKHTSFKCGGTASLLVVIESIDELRFALSVINAFNAPYIILGNGSNTLFSDKGYDGIVLKLSGDFEEIIIDGDSLIAGCGALLPYVSKVAVANGLSGMEALCGIPGSIGGAIYMDAGAYEHCMGDVVETVTAMTQEGEIFEYEKDELEFSYRHSLFMENGDVILFAKLKLNQADKDAIEEVMSDYMKRRKEKQPLNFPSAGSFFKRPEGNFAGALIEKSGLKGFKIGGAEVSCLHAGFIINSGNASASDVIELANTVIDRVYADSGIKLEPEVRIIGE